jgi:hypothetical protein
VVAMTSPVVVSLCEAQEEEEEEGKDRGGASKQG